MDMNSLSKNIKSRMKNLGLTQKQLADKAGTSQVTIHRMISGKVLKTTKIIELAKALRCDPEWLLNGKGEPNSELSNIEIGPELQGQYPVLSWVQAGDWTCIHEEANRHNAEHYPCPVKCSDNTFLLKVRGMSMSPAFNEGELLFIDPEVEPINGKYVIARLDDDNEATFKQLIIEGNQKYLKAANPSWPTPIQPINGNCSIVGVVVFVGRTL